MALVTLSRIAPFRYDLHADPACESLECLFIRVDQSVLREQGIRILFGVYETLNHIEKTI